MELKPHHDEPLYTIHISMNGEEGMENWLPASAFDDGTMRIGNVMLTKEQTRTLINDYLGYWSDLARNSGAVDQTTPQ